MLNLAVRNTGKLVREKSKSDNVRLGRLFTKKDTARLMADMIKIERTRTVYTILDVGAGTGILSAAVVERICRDCPKIEQIFLTCYENNPDFADMLEDNLERIRKKCRHDYDVRLFATVYRENFLTESKNHYTVRFFDKIPDKYDIVISNPPTDFAEKYSEDAEGVGGISQLKMSKAFLFLKNAKDSVEDDSYLRKAAIKHKVSYMTTMAAAKATADGIHYVKNNPVSEIKSLQELHSEIHDKD